MLRMNNMQLLNIKISFVKIMLSRGYMLFQHLILWETGAMSGVESLLS